MGLEGVWIGVGVLFVDGFDDEVSFFVLLLRCCLVFNMTLGLD